MKYSLWLLPLLTFATCQAQPPATTEEVREVGGPCEGCEALYEYGERQLTAVDTLPDFSDNTPRLLLTGRVLEPDGKTPAAGIILYIYHTDREGRYSGGDATTSWSRRHGRYRGWVRTDEQGRYAFYTFRPAAYPGGQEVEHVHLTVKEPGTVPYYLDEFVFADDPLLTPKRRRRLTNRGGSGIVRLREEGELLVGRRNIILGEHVEGY